MLGVNLLFAGFALTLNGISYLKKVDDNAKAFANVLVGLIIGINAVFQTSQAHLFADLPLHVYYGFSAAMWLFSLNYFLIAAHIFFKSTNWNVFGVFSMFAMLVSFTFAGEAAMGGLWVFVYLWGMWGVLWAQSFVSILLGSKAIDKLSPHVLILNGVASTFVPGFLMLLGVL
ncbi:MAG: AmiS/UreI family transporter [Defluviitaleaceae bacterium]|nr:AmiS/UreI family transporter [Defluviitaleaceae bacterium]